MAHTAIYSFICTVEKNAIQLSLFTIEFYGGASMKKIYIAIVFCSLVLFSITFLSCGEKAGEAVLACKLSDTWQYSLFYEGQNDLLGGMTMDGRGNLYVGGYHFLQESGTNIVTSGMQWIIFKSEDLGKTWKEDDRYTLDETINWWFSVHRVPTRAATDKEGRPYFVATAADSDGIYHWIVRRGENGGGKWETVDDYKIDDTDTRNIAADIAVTPTGEIYVVGLAGIWPTSYWVVRKSISGDRGSWSTKDKFQMANNKLSAAYAVTVDSAGAIYVAGVSYDSSSKSHWIVRKSTDGGDTWRIVSNFQFEKGRNSGGLGIGVNKNDEIYTIGSGNKTSNLYNKWLVRKSTDGGDTWTTVDEYSICNTTDDVNPWDIDFDLNGNPYVIGSVDDQNAQGHIVIRKSTDGGTTWSEMVNTKGKYNLISVAYGLFSDPFGNMYYSGAEVESLTKSTGFVNKLSCDYLSAD